MWSVIILISSQAFEDLKGTRDILDLLQICFNIESHSDRGISVQILSGVHSVMIRLQGAHNNRLLWHYLKLATLVRALPNISLDIFV